MKKLKRFLLVLCLLSFVLCMAACNPGTKKPQESVTASSSAVAYTSKEDAIGIACKDAGLFEGSIHIVSAKSFSNGQLKAYVLNFSADGKSYHYVIDANDGSIWENEEKDDHTQVLIGEASARVIALEHAQCEEKDVHFRQFESYENQGRAMYNIEFSKDATIFKYEIDAVTGEIVAYYVQAAQ